MYGNMKIYKHGNIQIYMLKNINVKNVNECVKKLNIYMKNYEIISNRNVDKETTKQNKEMIYKDRNVYKNI